MVLEVRSAEGKSERLKPMMDELLQLNLDVLVAAFYGAALTAKNATRTLPVVAAGVDDPVLTGLAATMARPGGNITGISGFSGELVAKRLQLVRELAAECAPGRHSVQSRRRFARSSLKAALPSGSPRSAGRSAPTKLVGRMSSRELSQPWRATASAAWSYSRTTTRT